MVRKCSPPKGPKVLGENRMPIKFHGRIYTKISKSFADRLDRNVVPKAQISSSEKGDVKTGGMKWCNRLDPRGYKPPRFLDTTGSLQFVLRVLGFRMLRMNQYYVRK